MKKNIKDNRNIKEKELVGSGLKNEEVFFHLAELNSNEFISKYKKILEIMIRFHNENNSYCTITDLAIQLTKEKNRKYIKILNDEITDEEIYKMGVEEIKLEIKRCFEDSQISRVEKIKQDIEFIKKDNKRQSFKEKLKFFYEQVVARGKLGESDYTLEEIQKELLSTTIKKDNKKSNADKFKEKVKNIHKKNSVFSTGYRNLDKMINKGFEKGHLAVIGARPNMGKTQFATNIFHNSHQVNKQRSLFIFLEGQKSNIWERLIVIHSQRNKKLHSLDNIHVKKNGLEELKKVNSENKALKANESLDKTGIDKYMIDMTNKNKIGINGLNNLLFTIEKELTKKPDIDSIIIDHIHKLVPERDGNDYYRMVFNELKSIASKHNVVIICLAQLNRNVLYRENKVPVMTDLRASGAIEEESDYVFFLYREDYQSERLKKKEQKKLKKNILEVYISKNREGTNGKVELYYDRSKGVIDTILSEEEARELKENNIENKLDDGKNTSIDKQIDNNKEKQKNDNDQSEDIFEEDTNSNIEFTEEDMENLEDSDIFSF